MALPGFTAEDSLYKTNGQYQVARRQAQIRGMVIPAQSNSANCTPLGSVSLTQCCFPDAYLPDCWRCSVTDSSGYAWQRWDQGDGCSGLPARCTPSSSWVYDAQGCKVWTTVHEDCSTETEVTDCPRPPTRGGGGTGPTWPERTCLLNGMPVPCEVVDHCLAEGTCEVIYKKR